LRASLAGEEGVVFDGCPWPVINCSVSPLCVCVFCLHPRGTAWFGCGCRHSAAPRRLPMQAQALFVPMPQCGLYQQSMCVARGCSFGNDSSTPVSPGLKPWHGRPYIRRIRHQQTVVKQTVVFVRCPCANILCPRLCTAGGSISLLDALTQAKAFRGACVVHHV
jgi:hypothetical protein